ncbi:transferrin-binding protein-like solute binding protein [Mannheimia indoligenes]|uniref:transferrin-binding protein-like solute binding protein n=1 Tax=Mannheimia indoligenes TaxID=3103145 RepID=UPI002FE6C2C9
MKKIILSTFAVLCALGMSACSSSSSSGGSNNKVDKQEYEILKSEVTDLNSTLSDLQSTLQRLQNKLASSQSASKSEIEKLETQLAEAKGNEAKTAELVQQLDEQLKNAIKAATESGDARLAEALAKSQEEVAAIKKQADDAAKKANDAINNAQKAQEDAAKAQEDLNKAKADLEEAKSRAPISDKIFGGSSGKMTAASGKLSGGVLVKDKDGTVSSIDAPDTREGISYITVIDDRGSAVDVGIDAVYTGWRNNLGGASRWDHSGATVRYGVYHHEGTEKGYVYSQGKATEVSNMPKEGIFTYLGNVGQVSHKYGSWGADSGSAYAKVNFADKTVRVELNTEFAATQNDRSVNAKVDAYTFDSKITENSISGVANENKEVKMQAGFFGDDAKYLSGIYQSDKVQGVFGVTKQ